MAWLALLNLDVFVLFTLVLTRVSGLVMTMPVFGTSEIPTQVRALLAFALALVITPAEMGTPLAQPATLVDYLVLVGSEILIGLSLGLGVAVLFSGAQLAGKLIASIGGMMVADVFDPTLNEEVPQVSRFLLLATLAVFLTIGGHRVVLAGLLDTFAVIPPGGALVPLSLADTLETLLTQSFSLGIRAAAPVITALLLATLVLGLISRSLPQLNLLMVGFGLNAVLTFAVLAISMGAVVWVFQEQLAPALETLMESLHVPSGSEWLR